MRDSLTWRSSYLAAPLATFAFLIATYGAVHRLRRGCRITRPRRCRRSPSPRSRPTGRRSPSSRPATSGPSPSAGGEARLLVSHSATESRPLYSPDGKRLAFVSTRTGNGDVYVLTFATGDVQPPDVRRRGRPARRLVAGRQVGLLLVRPSAQPRARSTTTSTASAPTAARRCRSSAGSTPTSSGAAPSPDGSLARVLRRRGRQPRLVAQGPRPLGRVADLADARSRGSRVALPPAREDAPTTRPTYEPLTPPGAKDQWPMWAPDGRTLYYVSDRDGVAQRLGVHAVIFRRPGSPGPPRHVVQGRPRPLAEHRRTTARRSSSSATSASGGSTRSPATPAS